MKNKLKFHNYLLSHNLHQEVGLLFEFYFFNKQKERYNSSLEMFVMEMIVLFLKYYILPGNIQLIKTHANFLRICQKYVLFLFTRFEFGTTWLKHNDMK